MQSAGGAGVEADEESKRRQREELMYWNAVHVEKMEKERKLAGADRPANKRGRSFEDFLTEDHTAEKGTYIYNTGADINQVSDDGMIRRRGEGVRGLNRGSIYANPFADEHTIDAETQQAIEASLMAPEVSERWEESDIYSASPRLSPATLAHEPQLIDTSEPIPAAIRYPDIASGMHESAAFLAAQAAANEAYANIHAWADNSNQSFYSPLPTTPRAATPQQLEEQAPVSPVSNAITDETFSEPDMLRSGEATPTDSASLVGEVYPEEVWGPRSGATSEHDVMSVDGEGISTPGSWTEVGSVVSENDVGVCH